MSYTFKFSCFNKYSLIIIEVLIILIKKLKNNYLGLIKI